MNPQPEPYIGNLFAILIGIGICYYAIKAYKTSDTNPISDLFTIGYIEEPEQERIHTNTTIVVNNPINNFESQPIYHDCIDALHALGMKKSEAKKRTKEIFNSMSTPPSSIQDFLMIALRKN